MEQSNHTHISVLRESKGNLVDEPLIMKAILE